MPESQQREIITTIEASIDNSVIVITEPTTRPHLAISATGTDDIAITVMFAEQTNGSPILMNQPTFTPTVYTPENAQRVIVAYALYTLNQCERFTATADTLPNHIHHLLVGNCALHEGEWDIVQAHHQQATDMGYYPAAINLAWQQIQRGDTQGAYDTLTQFQQAHVHTLSPRETIGWLANRAGVEALLLDYDSAIAHTEQALAQAEETPLSDGERAALYRQLGDYIFLIYEWDRVLDSYNTAISLAPGDAETYFSRGVLYYTQGPRPNARDDFEMFLALSESDNPHREQAQRYIDDITIELEALGGERVGTFGPSD